MITRNWLAVGVCVWVVGGLMADRAESSGRPSSGSIHVDQAAAPKAVRAYVTWTGPDSRVEKMSFIRIDSAEEWFGLWGRHTGTEGRTNHVGEPIGFPVVDFAACTVVACFRGNTHNSSGVYAVGIEEGEDVRLRIDERTYQTASFGPGGDGGAVKATPYGIFVLPRTDKSIVIQENTQSLKHQPATWTSRAVLKPARRAANAK